MRILPRLTHWIRISIAVVALAFGVLQIAAGLWGPEPIQFGFSEAKYYRVVATPFESFWLWGLLGLVVAVVLFTCPWRRRGER